MDFNENAFSTCFVFFINIPQWTEALSHLEINLEDSPLGHRRDSKRHNRTNQSCVFPYISFSLVDIFFSLST